MEFLFENIIGIVIGITIISLASFIKALLKDNMADLISETVSFISWYIITVLLNRYLPDLCILTSNKILYAFISIVYLIIITCLIKHFQE
ncbi:hypothetical protein [Vallitalea sp.]|jgi:hypothetical protein|uniref:hypothetical protein n=1 Tax=Vallitalea sp. TaxID=1882829 RepID=UPI0025FD2A73|nr:hypothetical protein [Vallitalea sp.]MCT4688858.1 hypothetical protein [Vallitalea sp.]